MHSLHEGMGGVRADVLRCSEVGRSANGPSRSGKLPGPTSADAESRDIAFVVGVEGEWVSV